ncbi:MAG TPA: hypothetical protein VGB59_09485 [Allosphingosinicella sp.]|jgi:ketosteroid isomerase-like protein
MKAVVRLALFALAPAFILMALPGRATVVPPPPPHQEELSMELQREIDRRARPGMNHQMRRVLSSVAVEGNYAGARGKAAFNLLLRDQAGWTSWRTGRPRPVPSAVAAELDRLLAGDAFWREQGFVYGYPCPGKGRVMQVFHRGHDKFTRQVCAPAGLAGRLADLAATELMPAGPLPSVGGREHMLRHVRGSDYEGKLPPPQDPDAAAIILHLTQRSVYELRDGEVEAHLTPYAEDVTIVWPTATELGKEALRRRVSGPTWNGVAKRNVVPGELYLKQTAADSFVITRSNRFWDGRSESQFWITSHWRKRGGRWEVVREEIGPQVPVASS